MTANAWKSDRGAFFYVAFAWLAVVAVVTGFSTTYWLPLARRTFAGPLIAHIHGLFFVTWFALLFAQVHFARAKKIRAHQKLGNLSLPLAVAMALSGFGIAVFTVRRQLVAGDGDAAYSQDVGVVTAMLLLLAFVAAALVTRRKPDWHKRFMLLASITILWPAWFRWRHLMPWLPRPELWLGLVVPQSLTVIAAVRDRIKFGRVHPVYLWFGLALMAEQTSELLLFDTRGWREVGRGMFTILSALGF